MMQRLADKENIKERLEKGLEKIKGSQFKDFKSAEFLRKLEEKAPQDIKERIRQARERFLDRLKQRLEKMPPQTQERFRKYIENVSGDPEKKKALLERLKQKLKSKPIF